ncbi:hypothetical protein Emag_004268 [Eimeria magna]
MEEYDSAFLEGVLDGLRESVDPETAQKMQKPSQFLWPEIGEQQSLSLRLNKEASARLSHLTLFASTKRGLGEPLEQDIVRRLIHQQTDKHLGNNKHNNLAALPPPSMLSRMRRISLATTKSSETEGEQLPLLPLEHPIRGSLEQQQQQHEHAEAGPASLVANSKTSSISVGPPRPFGGWTPVAVSPRSQGDAAAVILAAQQQERQQGGQKQHSAAARERASQTSRKRCESGLIDSGGEPLTPQGFASPQQQQTQQRTPRNAQVPSPVPSLVPQQQQMQRQQQVASQVVDEECDETMEDAGGPSPLTAAASSRSKGYDGGTQEECASEASSPLPELVPLKMPAAFDPTGTLAVSAAELFSAFHQQQAGGGVAAWRKTPGPQTTLQLLALVTRKVQEEKLAKVEEAQQTLQKLHEKVAKKLLNLLKAQEEERRQLGLAFAKAKSKLLARLETQARAAEAIPSLSLSAAKAANGDQVVEAASLEMQKILESAKRGILDKLAAATAYRAAAIPAAAAIAVLTAAAKEAAAAATASAAATGREWRDGAWRDYDLRPTGGCGVFLWVLKLATSLTQLELSKQALRDDGINILVPYLIKNKTLKPPLSTAAAAAGKESRRGGLVAADTSSSSSSRRIDGGVLMRRLGDFGAEALAAGLGSNTTLKVLRLNRNNIGEKGLIKIADSLSFNCSLAALGISENFFDAESLSAFGALKNHFMRVEPLALDIVIFFVGEEPRAIPDKCLSLLRQTAAALPPDPIPSSPPCWSGP